MRMRERAGGGGARGERGGRERGGGRRRVTSGEDAGGGERGRGGVQYRVMATCVE